MGKILDRLEEEHAQLVFANQNNDEKLEYLPVQKLKLPRNRVRSQINREDINAMAKNIKQFGILQPLEINERNEVVLGTRRLEAAKLAFLEKVPVIRRKSSELCEIEKQIMSDIHSKHLSVIERATAFHKLIELKGMSKYALANYLELSHNLVCRTLAVLEANENTKELMKQEKISQRKVAMVLYRLKDKSLEDFAINEIIEKKMNIVQAGNFVAEVNDPEIFKKHFVARIRSFRTSLLNFKEKIKLLNLDEDMKEEIKKELRNIRLEKIFE